MKLLGRAERVDIPAFGLLDVPAKVDTGAYSSSIDFSFATEVSVGEGTVLEFVLLHPETPGYSGAKLRTSDFETTEVTNAHGTQRRYVIFPEISLHGETRRCRLTLADRSRLRYPILLGRKFIGEADYLVNVTIGKGLKDDEEEREL
jgi:hypothetical protein